MSYYRERAQLVLKGKWGMAMITAFVASLMGGLLLSSKVSIDADLTEKIMQYLPEFVVSYLQTAATIGSILGIIQFVIGGAAELGYCRFLLKMEDGEDASIEDLFSQFHRLVDGLVMNLLRSVYITLWTMLFIIPGFVAVYKYAMAPFILLENPDMTANEAITASKKLMDGHKGDLFTLDLSFIGWDFLNLLTMGIGSLWLNPYKNAARAAFYRDLSPKPTAKPIVDETPDFPVFDQSLM